MADILPKISRRQRLRRQDRSNIDCRRRRCRKKSEQEDARDGRPVRRLRHRPLTNPAALISSRPPVSACSRVVEHPRGCTVKPIVGSTGGASQGACRSTCTRAPSPERTGIMASSLRATSVSMATVAHAHPPSAKPGSACWHHRSRARDAAETGPSLSALVGPQLCSGNLRKTCASAQSLRILCGFSAISSLHEEDARHARR